MQKAENSWPHPGPTLHHMKAHANFKNSSWEGLVVKRWKCDCYDISDKPHKTSRIAKARAGTHENSAVCAKHFIYDESRNLCAPDAVGDCTIGHTRTTVSPEGYLM
jgi:hypothetical protein